MLQAFDQGVAGKSGLNITYSEVTVPGQVQNGNAMATSWLTAHPAGGSKPLAIWSCWDEPMQGAVAALRQAGRTDVVTVSINGSPQGVQLVKDGPTGRRCERLKYIGHGGMIGK